MWRYGIGVAAMLAATPAAAQVMRSGPAEAAFATTVTVPPGATTLYVSGLVPDPADPAAPADSPAHWGDTEAQTRSVLAKLTAALAAQGMTPGDVVMLRVYLAAPAGAARMDFDGMTRAYKAMFGTPEQPNRPARATVQVAALVNPAFLVEIEATAAKIIEKRR
jgi:enamine deaminase RidA (YjgF/YER057c/UK114 family)